LCHLQFNLQHLGLFCIVTVEAVLFQRAKTKYINSTAAAISDIYDTLPSY